MARTHFHHEHPIYYPPRARWYAPFFHWGHALRRRKALDRVTYSRSLKIGAFVAGFFVPGLAVQFREPRIWGPAALLTSLALAGMFIVWLGYFVADVAFGLLLTLHVSGFLFYCAHLLADEPLRRRLAFTLLVLVGMWLLIYHPARNLVQNHGFAPLRFHGQVVVVRKYFHPGRIQRGDRVAYALKEDQGENSFREGAVWVNNGVTLGTVRALAGDQLTFTTNSYAVNGESRARLPHMPVAGEWVVPENHWFIWPNLDISGYGEVGEKSISDTMLRLADVKPVQFFGKPFTRWFGRKQALP